MALFFTVDYALGAETAKRNTLTSYSYIPDPSPRSPWSPPFSRRQFSSTSPATTPRLSPGAARHPGGDAEGRRRGAVPSTPQSLSILYRLWSYIKRGRSEDQLTARGGGGAHFGTGCSLTPPAQCRPLRPCSQVRASLISHDNSDNRLGFVSWFSAQSVVSECLVNCKSRRRRRFWKPLFWRVLGNTWFWVWVPRNVTMFNTHKLSYALSSNHTIDLTILSVPTSVVS